MLFEFKTVQLEAESLNTKVDIEILMVVWWCSLKFLMNNQSSASLRAQQSKQAVNRAALSAQGMPFVAST